MMCILLPISCWPFEKVLYFAQRLMSTAVTIISTFLCIISINVVTELFYLQTHQLENFFEEYEAGGRPQAIRRPSPASGRPPASVRPPVPGRPQRASLRYTAAQQTRIWSLLCS